MNAVDHFLQQASMNNQIAQMRQIALEESGLRQKYADAEASYIAYRALFKSVMDAYEAGDHQAVHTLLTDRTARGSIYEPTYQQAYNDLIGY